MREARVVLDLLQGQKLRSGLNMLRAGDRLCSTFGGYSAHVGFGCWRKGGLAGEDLEFDMNVEFRVAIPEGTWPLFCETALQLAEGQETVYVVSPWGETSILPVRPILDFKAQAVLPREEEVAELLAENSTESGTVLPPASDATSGFWDGRVPTPTEEEWLAKRS